ncbi:50S ribosomal protein L5 [Candidatus Dojkabacteria bacterium]|nr:50S ribosomal protein L5 [Candidatus Dojkabacteria bacterium]
MKNEPRLKEKYDKEVRAQLQKELGLDNAMMVPRFEKVVFNMGIGSAGGDKGVVDEIEKEMALIAGQKPVRTLARKAVAGFKVRKGDVVGMKVTLRGRRMWEFIDKLINVIFPRTKDFRGISADSFDGSGNLNIGIKEQTVFPEINPNDVTALRGLEITMEINSISDEHSKALLDKFGFPFKENGKKS